MKINKIKIDDIYKSLIFIELKSGNGRVAIVNFFGLDNKHYQILRKIETLEALKSDMSNKFKIKKVFDEYKYIIVWNSKIFSAFINEYRKNRNKYHERYLNLEKLFYYLGYK